MGERSICNVRGSLVCFTSVYTSVACESDNILVLGCFSSGDGFSEKCLDTALASEYWGSTLVFATLGFHL